MAFIFSVFAASWDLLGGYLGLLDFGHAAFFGIGAYASALVSLRLGASPYISFLLGGAISTIFGLLVGILSLRFTARVYFAICTLGFAESVRLVARNWVDLTRGVMGLWGFPTFPGFSSRINYYYLAFAFMVISITALYVLVHYTHVGRVFRAIKDNEVLAEHRGINVTLYKILCAMISALFAGLAGSMYAHYILLLTPEDVLAPMVTCLAIGMVVIGGTGTIIGSVIGAFIVVTTSEALRAYAEVIYNLLIFGSLIMVFAVYIRGGIMGLIKSAANRLRASR
jgi:branched-chain amino acid transport system permease protein